MQKTVIVIHVSFLINFRSHALSAEDMVFVTLRFLASGSILHVIGDLGGIDKSTASRCIYKIITAIARLRPRYIELPIDEEEINEARQGFYDICRFPRCIGAIDCTHVRIKSPGGVDAEIYRNRKGFFSFNVQVVCDSQCIIRNIVCRWQGSAHDSMIFANSRVRAKLENNDFGADSVIVGDSGYEIKKYLITPLAAPQTPAQILFNESQIRTRNPVERCFGIWKQRFPILALGIRLQVNKVQALVVATAVLHNIACQMRDQLPAINEDIEAAIDLTNHIDVYRALAHDPTNEVNENNITRHILINEYFRNLLLI